MIDKERPCDSCGDRIDSEVWMVEEKIYCSGCAQHCSDLANDEPEEDEPHD